MKTCESRLQQLRESGSTNHTLLSLLQRAFNRKSIKIRTQITQYLTRFLVIDSNSFSIYSQLRFVYSYYYYFQRILPLLYNPSFIFWINSICSKTNSPFFSPNSNSFATKLFKTLPFFFSFHFTFHLDETGFHRRIPWKWSLHHMVDFFFCRFCPLPRVFLNSVTSKRSLSASNVTSLLQFVAANLLSIEPQLLPSLFTSIVYIPVQQSILLWFKVHFPSHLHP